MNNQQIQYIVENYQVKTDKEIANELGYHPSSIKHTRLDLRLIKKTKGIKNAICHPDRRNQAFGLCKNCYDKQLKDSNPEYTQRQRINTEEWCKLNKERIRENGRKYVEENKDRVRRTGWLFRIKNQYNMSEDEYNLLMIEQNNECAICGNKPDYRLGVDHNHLTGNNRGLLCRQCNLLLGLLGDDIDKAKMIISYLEKYNGQDKKS